MAHPNEDLVRTGYERFLAGDLAALNDPFADDAVRRAPGKHQLAGDFHGKDEIPAAFAETLELTGGTVELDLHCVLADDGHAVVLVKATDAGGRYLLP